MPGAEGFKEVLPVEPEATEGADGLAQVDTGNDDLAKILKQIEG